jgi:type I restriction enzyme S subunit
MAGEWETARLGELVTFKTGKLDSNAAVPNGEYPFFTCSQETLRTNTYSFDTECVLLAGNNANGVYPLKYFRGKFDAYQRTYVVTTRDPERLTTKFLYYALRPKLSEFRNVSTGAATKFLTLTILNGTKIELPPLPVQRRIARILSSYDELIENNQRRIRVLEEMARALYREWFVGFHFPGYQKAKFVLSEVGDVPEDWEAKRIGANFKTVLGGTPSRSKREYWEYGSIPWINSGKVNDIRVTEASELITDLALQQSAAKLMPKGTTVLAITGATLGQVSYLEIETTANQSVVGIVDPTGLLCEWVYLTICDRIEGIIKHASGGAQQHINKEIVDNVILAIPSDHIAECFRRVVRPIFQQIATLLFQSNNLKQARDLLLPKLMSANTEMT